VNDLLLNEAYNILSRYHDITCRTTTVLLILYLAFCDFLELLEISMWFYYWKKTYTLTLSWCIYSDTQFGLM